MPKTKGVKGSLLQSYMNTLEGSDGYIAVNIDKVDNLTVTKLKKELKGANSKFLVVKNTVFKLALQDSSFPVETQNFDGQTAIVTYKDDPTAIAKLLKGSQKDADTLQAKYSYVEKGYYNAEQTKALAEVPSKPELLAKMLGSLNAPLTGFMTVLNGNMRGFVRALAEVQAKKA